MAFLIERTKASEAAFGNVTRRTGTVEANAGGVSVESIAAKMGNSIDQNRKLQKTYMPVSVAAVRAADEARKIGRQLIASEHNEFKKLKLAKRKS